MKNVSLKNGFKSFSCFYFTKFCVLLKNIFCLFNSGDKNKEKRRDSNQKSNCNLKTSGQNKHVASSFHFVLPACRCVTVVCWHKSCDLEQPLMEQTASLKSEQLKFVENTTKKQQKPPQKHSNKKSPDSLQNVTARVIVVSTPHDTLHTTRYTLHVTRFTSHDTLHTTCYTPHDTCYTPYDTC